MSDVLKTIGDVLNLAGAMTDLGARVAGQVDPKRRDARIRRRDLLRASRGRAKAIRLRATAATLAPRAQRRKARLLARARGLEATATMLEQLYSASLHSAPSSLNK